MPGECRDFALRHDFFDKSPPGGKNCFNVTANSSIATSANGIAERRTPGNRWVKKTRRDPNI
jgi:hypothetical protein